MHSFSTLKCPVCCAIIDICDVATLPNNIFAQHIIHLNQQLQTAYSQRVLLVTSHYNYYVFCYGLFEIIILTFAVSFYI